MQRVSVRIPSQKMSGEWNPAAMRAPQATPARFRLSFALIAGLPKGMPNTTSEGGARHEEPGDNGGPPSAPPFGSLWRARI